MTVSRTQRYSYNLVERVFALVIADTPIPCTLINSRLQLRGGPWRISWKIKDKSWLGASANLFSFFLIALIGFVTEIFARIGQTDKRQCYTNVL